jgi:predicted negative regulator of RcsB-dependent stress response
VEPYNTEEEQVEALRRWWDENGRSTIAAVVIALAAGFGWQGWQKHDQGQSENASDLYQALLQAVNVTDTSGAAAGSSVALAEQLKTEYGSSTYAQFAAMHLARNAVSEGDLAEAEAQLRWVLAKTDKSSDSAQIAQLRLARVLASSGNPEQALTILEQGAAGPYEASYAAARGDVLLGLGREDEARAAYNVAQALSGGGMSGGNSTLQQKLQSLNPVPARELDSAAELVSEPVPDDAPAPEAAGE